MKVDLRFFWGWRREIGRIEYLLAGSTLMLVKFGIDWTVATRAFGRPWSPRSYLVWPDASIVGLLDLPPAARAFPLTMLAIALPFIWTGVVLTVQRLRSAGLPIWLVLLFFVPVVNLLLFAMLTLLPIHPQRRPAEDAPGRAAREAAWRGGMKTTASALLAIVISVAAMSAIVAFGVVGLASYGWGVFVGAPFALGLLSAVVFGIGAPRSRSSCLLVATIATIVSGAALVAFALEGAGCLLMASPLAFGLSLLGALVGYGIQAASWLDHQQRGQLCIVLIALLPAHMTLEATHEPEPVLRAVRTAIIVDAPPERVWPHVVAFPPLDEPDELIFRLGIAFPQRAEIVGTGAGAVRHCIFSTGTFVEPIEIWDPPALLRFAVTEQPAPMREWSPYEIEPPHLDNYLVSRRGQFRLEPLPGGRTLLEGTTWYTNRMWPAAYWHLWSDHIIHTIHRRVLQHVAAQVEER